MMMRTYLGLRRAVNYTLNAELMAKIAKLPPRTREAALREIGKIEWTRCSEDVLYWLDPRRHPALPYVYTHDPHIYFLCGICADGNTYQSKHRKSHLKLIHEIEPKSEAEMRGYFSELPTKRPFPLYDYMIPIIDTWLNEQFVLVEKSRDMVATWTMVMLYTWDTLFHEGRQNIFQSEDSMKTSDLVKRAWFIYKSQPRFLKTAHPAQPSLGLAKAGRLRVDTTNSEIMGFPQGADQIRQYHPSGILLDEAAYLVDAGDTFAAIKPSIEQGGRFSAISSANCSWFMRACQDTLDTL
jgi:hypothetical protein